MSAPIIIWGLIAVITGVVVGVYGNSLFRMALAAAGFGIGFLGALALLEDQSGWIRLLIAIVAGGICAVVLYSLVRFSLYIAGAILGLVIALVVGALLHLLSGFSNSVIMLVLTVAGLGCGGFFGPRLGNFVINLATSAAGAYMIAAGFTLWFAGEYADSTDLRANLTQWQTLAALVVLTVIFYLGQLQAARIPLGFGRR